jgi:SPP1 family predicted phage head-tail adaptor
MKDIIVILNPPARNEDGTFADPTTFATSWAKITALQGRELYKAQEVVQEVTHMITIPFLAGLEENMTVSFDSRIFVIQAIQDPDERRVELRLLCVERNQNA